MKFGVEIPTCTAGMMYPVPFATVQDVIRLALEAEQLGYHDVSGNDHLSTQRYVREAWTTPPDYFEPLTVLANVAAKTSVVRLTTGILVLPMRDPVLLAKQVATLDQALRVLFNERRSTYRGKYRRFEDVESFPKPIQSPLPIYSGGNVEGSIRRAAELCEGWLPAKLGPGDIRAGRAKLDEYARKAGREPSTISTALQSVVCMGETTKQAHARFTGSSFDLFRGSLAQTMTKGVSRDAYLAANLIGNPDEVCEKVAAFERAGLDHFCATLFVGNTVNEVRDQMRMFSRYVLPAFPERGRAA